MSYRPIADLWILARAKLKPNPDGTKRFSYGAYLGGFPERARALLPRVGFPDELLRLVAQIAVDMGVDGHRADLVMMKTAKTMAARAPSSRACSARL